MQINESDSEAVYLQFFLTTSTYVQHLVVGYQQSERRVNQGLGFREIAGLGLDPPSIF